MRTNAYLKRNQQPNLTIYFVFKKDDFRMLPNLHCLHNSALTNKSNQIRHKLTDTLLLFTFN